MFSLKAFSATFLRLSASLLQPAANDEVLQCNVLFIHTTYLPKSKPRRLAYICDVYSHIHSTVCMLILFRSVLKRKFIANKNDTDNKQCGACLIYSCVYFHTSYGLCIGNLGKSEKCARERESVCVCERERA